VNATTHARAGGETWLSPVELDACWELLGLGDPPATLRLPSPGRSWSDRRRHLDSVLAELRRRGLADRSRPDERLARMLRALARPQRQLDLILHGEHGTLVAIGADTGGSGVLAVRHGEQIRLAPVPLWALVRSVVELVGPITPGYGRSVNLPAEVFDAARKATHDGELWTLADRMVAMGIPPEDASSCVRMCAGVRMLGQLGTLVRQDGVKRFGPWVIGFHLTKSGHFLQLRRPYSGTSTITISPLDAPRLTRHTEELLAAGAGRQPQHRHTW
jgi:ESX secretion-associated protein EspG